MRATDRVAVQVVEDERLASDPWSLGAAHP